MKLLWIPLAALVVMAGCNNPISDPVLISQCGPEISQERAEDLAKECVGILPLIDPESARIRGVTVDGPRKWTNIKGALSGQQVSFMLNSKNTFGGYTGDHRFVCLLQANGRYNVREATAWDR